MTLEDVFQFIEAKEAGKRSAGRLLEAQTANAARSQYRRTKQEEMKNRQPEKGDKCHYCGQYGHGKRAPPTIRKTTCLGKPADIVVAQIILMRYANKKKNQSVPPK
jgi:hypothetical protein